MAVIAIKPLVESQSVGLALFTSTILGADGAANTTGLRLYAVTQEPSVLRTLMLYVPEFRLVNTPDGCQLLPPLMEYSTVPPVAAIVILPSLTPQLVGSVATTLVIAVGVGATMVTVFGATVTSPVCIADTHRISTRR